MKKIIIAVLVILLLVGLFIFGRETKLYKKMVAWLYGNKYGAKTKPYLTKVEEAADKVKHAAENAVQNAAQELAPTIREVADRAKTAADKIQSQVVTEEVEK